MNFSEFDIKILVVSILALLLISATASATPIAGGFGDVPNFEHTATFDATAPEQPGDDSIEDSSGTLYYGEGIAEEQNTDIIFSGYYAAAEMSVSINDRDGNQSDLRGDLLIEIPDQFLQDVETIEVGEETYLNITSNNNTVIVRMEYVSLQNNVSTVEWEVTDISGFESENNSSSGPLSAIANWLGYFAELFQYVVAVLFDSSAFILITIKDLLVYGANITGWITTGYGSIVSSAPSWAAPFVSIPPLLTGFELMKLLFIAIELVWI